MEITYQVETLEESKDSVDLLKANYKELEMHQDKMTFNPDYNLFKEIEKKGGLHIVTARKDKQLIGYFVTFISVDIHRKDHKMATNDLLYVTPLHRLSGTAREMVIFAMEDLKRLGVSAIRAHTTIAHDISKFLESKDLGFKKIGYIHEKLLI